MSEKPVPVLLPWREVVAGRTSRQNTPKTTEKLAAPRIKILKPVNDHFAVAVDYWNYRILKKSSQYDASIAHKLQKKSKNIDGQMEKLHFSVNGEVSVFAFLQEFQLTCYACEILKDSAVGLFTQ